MSYVSTKDLHEDEIKARFTEDDGKKIRAAARQLRMPPAVFVRIAASMIADDSDLLALAVQRLFRAAA